MWKKQIVLALGAVVWRSSFLGPSSLTVCHAQSLRSSSGIRAVDSEAVEVVDNDTMDKELRRLKLFGNKNKEEEAAAEEAVEDLLQGDEATDGNDNKKKNKKGKKDKKDSDKKKKKKDKNEDLPIIEDGYFEEDGDEIDHGEEQAPVHQAPPKKIPPVEIAGDKRTVENLSINFQAAKARLFESLKKDYGEDNFETLWMDTPQFSMPNNETTRCTMGRNAFRMGSRKSKKSWYRTVRKMKINLLQYLVSGDVQDFVWATA